jgi:hypothetical protein
MTAIQKAVEDEKGGPNIAPDPTENKVRSYVTLLVHDMCSVTAVARRSDCAH